MPHRPTMSSPCSWARTWHHAASSLNRTPPLLTSTHKAETAKTTITIIKAGWTHVPTCLFSLKHRMRHCSEAVFHNVSCPENKVGFVGLHKLSLYKTSNIPGNEWTDPLRPSSNILVLQSDVGSHPLFHASIGVWHNTNYYKISFTRHQ